MAAALAFTCWYLNIFITNIRQKLATSFSSVFVEQQSAILFTISIHGEELCDSLMSFSSLIQYNLYLQSDCLKYVTN